MKNNKIEKLEKEQKNPLATITYARKLTLEETLTVNLRELEENPDAEILPITAGYLAHQKGKLSDFLTPQKETSE